MLKLNSNQKALVDFIEEAAPGQPVQRRVRLYRGLADCIGVKHHRTRLLKKAIILETAERQCAELNFDSAAHDGQHAGNGGKS